MEDNKKFVGLERAREVRIYNLTAVKEVINANKSYFKLKILRDKKIKLISNIRKESKEIQVLFNKLYEVLPEHEILELRKRVKQKEKGKKNSPKKKSKKKKIAKSAAESEIDKLERSLAKIEEKLKGI